jgi:hypothetical protein
MRRALCAFFLAAGPLFWPTAGLHAEEHRAKEEKPAKKVEISSEDRKVIRMMELLQRMELLKDLALLEGEIKAGSEDKK